MGYVTCYLGLGSNLGDRAENLRQARRLLDNGEDLRVTGASPVYETAPWGYTEQPCFLNCALAVQTTLPPRALLERAKEVERQLGREPSFRYGPRAIDVDILLYGGQVVDSPELQVPHPRLPQRAFVLVPLAALCPEMEHPVCRKTIGQLAREAEDAGTVRPLGRL